MTTLRAPRAGGGVGAEQQREVLAVGEAAVADHEPVDVVGGQAVDVRALLVHDDVVDAGALDEHVARALLRAVRGGDPVHVVLGAVRADVGLDVGDLRRAADEQVLGAHAQVHDVARVLVVVGARLGTQVAELDGAGGDADRPDRHLGAGGGPEDDARASGLRGGVEELVAVGAGRDLDHLAGLGDLEGAVERLAGRLAGAGGLVGPARSHIEVGGRLRRLRGLRLLRRAARGGVGAAAGDGERQHDGHGPPGEPPRAPVRRRRARRTHPPAPRRRAAGRTPPRSAGSAPAARRRRRGSGRRRAPGRRGACGEPRG